jgi:starch-binding outer membrane protein, SusD/RagB family
MKSIKILFLILAMGFFSCTKLNERFRSSLEAEKSLPAAQLLRSAYDAISGTYQTGDFWHISQHTSDETIGPTRGPDWDDNGQWRALHAHTWNAEHGIVGGAFNGLLGAQFAASNVLQYNPSTQQAAEARFIRALSMYSVLDGWDQVPYRENLTDYKIDPQTLKGKEAADFIISELTAIINDLPAGGNAYVANKNAARALLMKVHLNYGVFSDRAKYPTYDFPTANMDQVIAMADQITGYAVAPNKYFDNFAPNNHSISTENIFTFYNQNGDRGQNIAGTWFSMAHYNMDPGGWNGFATLSDFYNKFEATDERLGKPYTYPGAQPNPGSRRNVGFLIGQQYNLTTDAPLQDRGGSPLVFTPQVSIRETGSNLEVTGIRVDKYAYDYAHKNSQSDNDWAFFRYSDVVLMKAEALLRKGNAAAALLLVNSVRSARGATPLVSLTLDNLLDERGRELYYEGWRRQDLIRFGKYLNAWQEKPADSGTKNLLFPIPANQLAVNPNLTQNPGY